MKVDGGLICTCLAGIAGMLMHRNSAHHQQQYTDTEMRSDIDAARESIKRDGKLPLSGLHDRISSHK